MSIASPEAAIRSDFNISYDLQMRGGEEKVTLYFRPTVIPRYHLLDHNERILCIREHASEITRE